MKNSITLERQVDGNYSFVESEPETVKAEMKQSLTAADLKAMGLSDEQVNMLQGIKSDTTANMEMSFGGIGSTLDKVTSMQFAGIPLGEAAMGGVLAIVLDRIVIARLDPTNKWGSWANLAAAFAVKKYGGKFLGNKTADAAALILTYEAIADYVTTLVNKVPFLAPKATSSQVFKQTSGSVMHAANQVANDYYSAAFGGQR